MSYLLGTVEIKIPGKKNGKQLVVLGLFQMYSLILVTLFGAILVTVGSRALSEGKIDGWLLLLIPLFIGLVGTAYRSFMAAYLFLWQLGGLEKIEVLPGALRIHKTIFGIGRAKEYPREQIKVISIAPPSKVLLPFTNLPSTQFLIDTSGPLYIQHGETNREAFGLGLDPQQAEKIVAILKQRLSL